jgi:hypothetical protein
MTRTDILWADSIKESGPAFKARHRLTAEATLRALLWVGIEFSVPEADLRQWLNNREFTPYPALAEALLKLLEGKRLRKPVYLDVIRFKYEDVLGASSPRSVEDVDFDKLKEAVRRAYNERHGEAVRDFQTLVSGALPAFVLGAPDALSYAVLEGQSVTLNGFRRASYTGLADLLGAPVAGDAVTPDMLANADIIAFEHNGTSPAFSGGWESCDWQFSDGQGTLSVHWDQGTIDNVIGGQPVPHDPHVVANGSITGAAYCAFFGITEAALLAENPGAPTPEDVVVSFLLFRVRPEIDVSSPTFEITLSGVPSSTPPHTGVTTPDADSLGVLVHPSDSGDSKPLKPKQSAARKVQDLCRSIGIQDAILPALEAVWDRHESGEPSRNEFEGAIYRAFDKLDDAPPPDAPSRPSHHEAMGRAFAGYSELRKNGTGECLFDDRLANAVSDRPLEKAEFADALLREGFTLAGQQMFPSSGGVMGPGQVRPWRKPSPFIGPGSPPAEEPLAPWPWLVAIRPNPDHENEFGNRESFFREAPGGFVQPHNYQYDQTCEVHIDASGGFHPPLVVKDCKRVLPPPAPVGGLFGGNCEGGVDYTDGNNCLLIPAQRPGASIKLRGFNFITPSVKVHFRSREDPALRPIVQDGAVWGDRETSVTDEQGKVIADHRVSDEVDVRIPSEHPDRKGVPLAPGLYDVFVSVSDPAGPVERTSNVLLLRVEPSENLRFQFRSAGGRCIEETSGLGDDEIWWDAFVGHMVPDKEILEGDGSTRFRLKDMRRESFPRPPWEDMDDGERREHDVTLFDGAFELGGVVAFAIVGLEVDSEAAARDQLRGFGDAFGEALSSIGLEALGLEVGGAGLAAQIAGTAAGATVATVLPVAIIVAAVIAAIVLISVIFWAVWAPADLIALDVFCLDSRTAWDRTDPKKPPPIDTHRSFRGEDELVNVTQRALPQRGFSGAKSATWVQENQYDVADAKYALEFRLARSEA